MRPFSVGCIAKDVSSGRGELAVPHKCHNPRRNLRWLRSLEASYHWHFFLRSSHCAIFMSTLKVSEVYFCSSILYLSQCSPFTLFLHSVSSKKRKNLDVFRSRAEYNSQGPDNPRTGRTKKKKEYRFRGMGGAAPSWGRRGGLSRVVGGTALSFV